MANDSITPQVSVVIPNYNGEQLLPKHIPHVLACLQNGDEVIVVDDASDDSSVAWLKSEFALRQSSHEVFSGSWKLRGKSGSLSVLTSSSNMRFAATCNKGVSYCQGSLIFLLNTDVSPEKSCRDQLFGWFSDPKVFAVGCLEHEDSVRGAESGKNDLWFEKGIFFHSKADNMDTGETAWVSGGSGMFRKSLWKQLQGFDLGFAPAYWEDIDLSYRAKKLGYQVLFDRAAVVIHQHETTNAVTFSSHALLQMSWTSSDLFARKHATVSQLFQYYVWRPFWWWKRFALLH